MDFFFIWHIAKINHGLYSDVKGVNDNICEMMTITGPGIGLQSCSNKLSGFILMELKTNNQLYKYLNSRIYIVLFFIHSLLC